MNCEEIQNLLSGYLDGELEEPERRQVEKHLENCPGCAEELSGLKECVKSLGSLKKVKPPPDFLNRVHARLEDQSAFKAAIKKIFFPVRFKIPLEAAGLAAAAVLIVYLLNISPREQSAESVPVSASIKVRKEVDKSLAATGAAEPISYPEEPRAIAGRMTKPAPPAGQELLELEEAAPFSVPAAEDRGGGTERVELVLLIQPGREFPGKESRASRAVGMKEESIRSSEILEAKGKEQKSARDSSALIRIKDLIAREGGEIISPEDKTDLIRRIVIKLPPDRYRSFLEKLSEIGDLQPSQLDQPIEAPITLRLR